MKCNQTMFGFLSPMSRIPAWRRSYARVCQYQRLLFGVSSLPFLSYEAVFLYQVAVDVGLIPALDEQSPMCCRLKRLPKQPELADEQVGTYAASFGVLLAGVKLDDDVRDSGRIFQRLLRFKYRGQVREARALLEMQSPGVVAAVENAIADHVSLEQSSSRIDVADYVKPTARGFEAVFAGFLHDRSEQMRAIGERVGSALIAWDCAVDFDQDVARGDYTPLASEEDVRRAFDFCSLQLAELGWSLPEGSVSGQLVASVARRVRLRRVAPVARPHRLLERWGLLRQKGYTYAGCDGCEAICCVGECAGGGAEAAGCCAEVSLCEAGCCVGEAGCCAGEVGFCCCDPSCCDSSKGSKKVDYEPSKSQAPAVGPYAEFFGQIGQADNELAPTGFVMVNGIRVPGTSEGGLAIEAGTKVRIVATDSFGVRVVPATD